MALPFGIMGATRWLPRTTSVRTSDRGFGGKPPSGFPLIPASYDAGWPIIKSIESSQIPLWVCIILNICEIWVQPVMRLIAIMKQ